MLFCSLIFVHPFEWNKNRLPLDIVEMKTEHSVLFFALAKPLQMDQIGWHGATNEQKVCEPKRGRSSSIDLDVSNQSNKKDHPMEWDGKFFDGKKPMTAASNTDLSLTLGCS